MVLTSPALFQPSLLQFGSTGLQVNKNTLVKVSETVTISCSQPGYVNPGNIKKFDNLLSPLFEHCKVAKLLPF